MRKSPWLREILTLDPERDAHRIVYLDTVYEFPFDTTRSLELALFRTFGSPSVSRLLDETQEFATRAQRRYDDTDLILSTIAEAGYDSDEGKRAIRRMNRLHRRFDISNEDFLYVLSTFVYEPIRWNARFGWRRLVDQERLALVPLLARGRRSAWRSRTSRRATTSSSGTTSSTSARTFARRTRTHASRARHATCSSRWFPGVPKKIGGYAIAALMDERLREAIGFPRPPHALVRTIEASLAARAASSRCCRRAASRSCGRS